METQVVPRNSMMWCDVDMHWYQTGGPHFLISNRSKSCKSTFTRRAQETAVPVHFTAKSRQRNRVLFEMLTPQTNQTAPFHSQFHPISIRTTGETSCFMTSSLLALLPQHPLVGGALQRPFLAPPQGKSRDTHVMAHIWNTAICWPTVDRISSQGKVKLPSQQEIRNPIWQAWSNSWMHKLNNTTMSGLILLNAWWCEALCLKARSPFHKLTKRLVCHLQLHISVSMAQSATVWIFGNDMIWHTGYMRWTLTRSRVY